MTKSCNSDGNILVVTEGIRDRMDDEICGTVGSGGVLCFLDTEHRRRWKAMRRCNDSISCEAFSRDGSLAAYAVRYDWRFGVEGLNPDTVRSHIFLRQV